MEVSSSGRQPVCPKEVLKHSKAGLEDAGGEEEGSHIFGAQVLKGKVIPIIGMSINSVVFVIITSA